MADDVVAFTTSNFTTTQFGWGKIRMECQAEKADVDDVREAVEGGCKLFWMPVKSIEIKETKPTKKAPQMKLFREDVFSEVNAFIIIEDAKTAEDTAQYFDKLWNHQYTENVSIPF